MWFLSMVAEGDRKDFLQFLRMVHFLRKCTMRKNCKRDATEAEPLTASLSTDGGKTYKLLGSGTDTTYTSGKIGLRTFGTGKFDNVTASSN